MFKLAMFIPAPIALSSWTSGHDRGFSMRRKFGQGDVTASVEAT